MCGFNPSLTSMFTLAGGTDPSSGTTSVHEVIRGLGALLRTDWKPLRTIVIASWDAEEFSIVGSTEWCEDFAEFLGNEVKVVAYVNVGMFSLKLIIN
jgi:N-acetylated-alpha-linked acidic dipeptidase